MTSHPTPSGNLGLIGCGLMGHGIAKNLLRAGHAVTILDHPGNQPCDDLAALGAGFSTDLGDITRAKDAVLVVLPGSPEVETVVLGDGGLLQHLERGTLLIDATTAEPEETLKIAAAVQAHGCAYVDAPMTRTPKEAEEGRLNVLLGGAHSDVARARVYIEAYAENIYHGGGVSAGHRLKLLHNFVSLGQAVVVSEAVAAADKGGVDLNVLTEVLATGGAGGVALERLRPYIEQRDTSSFRFAIRNAAKDLDYYTRMAVALDAQHEAAQAVHHVLTRALERAGVEAVMPQLIDILGDKKDA
ncbi:NAD(P)-dependent oxidoreductase [Magnetovibrio sp.]|uniref:NAD(P)-dependent oxidoreductase n=1 Tax=Magnetovibrio sp. TaxID=2024836 RepID=UPI002F9398DD